MDRLLPVIDLIYIVGAFWAEPERNMISTHAGIGNSAYKLSESCAYTCNKYEFHEWQSNSNLVFWGDVAVI